MAEEKTKPGYFGEYGGSFIPEILAATFAELRAAYGDARSDPAFWAEYKQLMSTYSGRPTPLTYAENLTQHFGGAHIYIKREDLNHTGAHKINNTIGQILLAKRMGKGRIIAETGAGQHGVATATVCALFGLPCVVYMGETDVKRQRPNVVRMKMLGAEIVPVTAGTGTLKDAMNEALRDWVTNVDDTFYIIGTVAGPHPYPMLVRDFNAVVGREARRQSLEQIGRLPDALVACVGGGSNAMGLFYPFVEDEDVRMYGVEAGGDGVERHLLRLRDSRQRFPLGELLHDASVLLRVLLGKLVAGVDRRALLLGCGECRQVVRHDVLPALLSWHGVDALLVQQYQRLLQRESFLPDSGYAIRLTQGKDPSVHVGCSRIGVSGRPTLPKISGKVGGAGVGIFRDSKSYTHFHHSSNHERAGKTGIQRVLLRCTQRF